MRGVHKIYVHPTKILTHTVYSIFSNYHLSLMCSLQSTRGKMWSIIQSLLYVHNECLHRYVNAYITNKMTAGFNNICCIYLSLNTCVGYIMVII